MAEDARTPPTSAAPELVLFFDGVCGLCNGFVDFVMRIDRRGLVRFSPLQSEFAARTLGAERTARLDSVILYDRGAVFDRSDAVLTLANRLGGVWSLAARVRVLPRGLRDRVYDLVASERYRIFGRRDTCRLPTPQERERFIL